MTGDKLTKADVVDAVYQKTGMNRKEIREIVDLFLLEIKEALVKGTAVEIRGFGTFESRIRKGRSRARNPRTGKPVTVNSHGIAAFRPGRELKQEVWKLGNSLVEEDPASPDSGGGK
jgi:integration host factor subunit beta